MKTKMNVEGIKEPISGGIYRDLDGDDNGILYYKDRVMKLLVRQVMPQDLEVVKEARRIEAEKFYTAKKDESGKMMFMKLSEVREEDSDEKILDAIKKANPVNNDDGDIALIVFNMRKSRCLCVAELDADPDNIEVGKITFTFFPNSVRSEQEERMIKLRVQEIILESKMYDKLYEEVVDPAKNDYVLTLIK